MLPEDMRPTVDALLRRKMAADESGLTARLPDLDGFLQAEMARIRQAVEHMASAPAMDWADINRLFRRVIDMAWTS
ncbi:MAG: DNA polymerase beta superfamily protein [Aristaeellaceae bacterium]